MTDELHAIAWGRVQGVWFRQFTQTRARELGLTGWVLNRDDGVSVELVARGPREKLELLLAAVAVGPEDARVDRVESEWRSPGNEPFDGFRQR